jgi:type VI secretion system protein ImpJ
MTDPAVHWHEGMFLRPQHLQAAQRHSWRLGSLGDKWDLHYNWGLRAIDLDTASLANHRLVIRALQARFGDGTLVSIPQDGSLPPIDLKPAFEQHQTVDVFLGVPVFQPSRANVALDGMQEGRRYTAESVDLLDENTGQDPQPVQIRRLNVRVLLSTQDRGGYDTLRIGRIEKSSAGDAAPQLDVTYIPPLLTCDAWKPLRAGILEAIFDRIGKKIDLLAGQVLSRGIAVDSQASGDALIVSQLRVLNEAYALLGVMIFADGVHPLPAYLELCRLVGQLAIYYEGHHRPPELPRYNHDDLGRCFYRVQQYLYDLLKQIQEPAYEQVPFVGSGLKMQVGIKPEWVEPAWEMYIGVQGELPADDCVRLLTRSNQLDMKMASADRVENIFRGRLPGLKFDPRPSPPRILPTRTGLTYFQVARESLVDEWENVRKSLTLAIRLNERRIEGKIDGERELRITMDGETTKLQFTLYIIEAGKT